MQIKDVLVLGLAAIVLADCNEDQDGSNDCSSTTRVVTSTTTDAQGVVITNVQTTTDTGLTTSLVPVYTPVVSTTTDVGVDTDRNTISRTTDIGTSASTTLYATTTDVGLQSGYAYTTNSDNETVATYTGTDTNQPSTQSITNTAGAAGAASTGNNDKMTTTTATTTLTRPTARPTASPWPPPSPTWAPPPWPVSLSPSKREANHPRQQSPGLRFRACLHVPSRMEGCYR